MNTISKLLGGVAMVGLAACSESNTVSRGITISPEEEATRTFAARDSGNVDAGGAISLGETLTARSVSVAGQSLVYGGGETSLIDAQVAVERNAVTGELTVTINGEPYDFIPADRDQFNSIDVGYDVADEAAGVFVSLYNFSGSLDELLNEGGSFAQAIFVQSNQFPDNLNVRAWAVIGTETADSALAGLPTATYDGRSVIVFTPDTGFAGFEDETRLESRLAMTADFGAGRISGNLSELTIREGGGADRDVAGTIAMNQTSFGVNGFEGSLNPDAEYAASGEVSIQNGVYSGAFYGPTAEEVGGAISATGMLEGAGVNGAGFFLGYIP